MNTKTPTPTPHEKDGGPAFPFTAYPGTESLSATPAQAQPAGAADTTASASETFEQRLNKIRDFGDSELINAVRTGQVPIHKAIERIDEARATLAPVAAQQAAARQDAVECVSALRAEPAGQQGAWIAVKDQLPQIGELVLVYSPPTKNDYPDTVNIGFDCMDPDSDDGTWLSHNEHYEHWCCVAKSEGSIGPSAEAPYTHWMPLPQPPKSAQGKKGCEVV